MNDASNNGHVSIPFDPIGLKRARQSANEWTADQAVRFGVEPCDILAAIRNGWLPGQIEALSLAEGARLADPPPLDPELAEKVRNIRNAEVRPIVPGELGTESGPSSRNVGFLADSVGSTPES